MKYIKQRDPRFVLLALIAGISASAAALSAGADEAVGVSPAPVATQGTPAPETVPVAPPDTALTPTPRVDPIAAANGRVGGGIALGYAGGSGLAYRRHFADGTGFQIAGMGWGNSNSSFMNLGFTRMYTVGLRKHFRAYVPVAASVIYMNNRATGYCYGYYYSPSNACGVNSYTYNYNYSTGSFNLGSGFGVELHTNSSFGISLDMLMTLRVNLIGGAGFDWVYPVPAASFVYYF